MFKKVKVPTIEGENIVLRMWNRKDAADLYAYAKNPAVGPAAGWPAHRTVDESRYIINEIYLSRIDWAIVDKASETPIGNIGFDEDVIRPGLTSYELGYSISEEYWGKGVATEAVKLVVSYAMETLGLDSITIRISPDNKASCRVAEKAGFVREGVLRQAYLKYDRKVEDVVCYSLLRSDYFGADI